MVVSGTGLESTKLLTGTWPLKVLTVSLSSWSIVLSDFGNLTQVKFGPAGAGSKTRAVFMAGGTPSRLSEIDFVTFSSTGDAADFDASLLRCNKVIELDLVAQSTNRSLSGKSG